MQIDPTVRYRHYKELFAMVNGQRYPLSELPARSVAIDGTRSTCDAPIRDLLPQDVAGMPITVEYKVNGKRGVFYQGIVGQRNYGVPPVDRTVQAYDILSRIDQAEGEECGSAEGLLFDNTPWPTAIRQVLNRAGIADTEIASIYDPGTVFNVGTIEPICHTADESLTSIYRALLTMVGAVGWCLPASGQVKIERFSTIPPASPSIAISNTASNAYRWNKADYVATGRERIVKRFTCTGGEVENGVAVESTWVAPDIEVGINDSESCEYWQTQAQVDAMAQWYGEQACREEVTVEVEVPADMGWLPGLAAALTVGKLGLASEPAMITAVRTDGVRSTLTCAIGDSKITGYLDTLAPICDFAMLIVAERVLISGQPQTIYDVYVDASSSYDPDGELVSYAWSVSGATPLNTVVQAAQTTIVLDTLEGVEITLTVTDDTAPPHTDTLTRATDAPDVQVWTRVLSTACWSNGWRILVDQSGWKSFTRAGERCIAVPAYNNTGPLLSFWSDGKVFRWEDYDADPVYVGTLPAVPPDRSVIWVTEGVPEDIWVTDGSIWAYHSTDGGVTWKTIDLGSGNYGMGVETGYNNPSYVRVATSGGVLHSYSRGQTWEQACTVAAPPDVRARVLASGFGLHLTTFLGTSELPPADIARFDDSEAASTDWSGVASPPTGLGEITPLLTTPGFVVAERRAPERLFVLTGDASNIFTASELNVPLLNSLFGLVRDGLLPDVIYIAGELTSKLLTLSDMYQIDTIKSYQIGYGALWVAMPPAPPVRVFMTATNVALQTGLFVSENNAWQYITHSDGGEDSFYVTSEWGTWVVNRVLYAIDMSEPVLTTQTGATLQPLNGINPGLGHSTKHGTTRQYVISSYNDNPDNQIGIEHGTNLALGTIQRLRHGFIEHQEHHSTTVNNIGRFIVRDAGSDGAPSYSTVENGVINEGALSPSSAVVPMSMFHTSDWRWLAQRGDGTSYERPNGEWVRIDSDGSVNTLSFTSYSDVVWAQPGCAESNRVYLCRDNKVYQCNQYGAGTPELIFNLHAQSPTEPLPEGKPITDFAITSFTVTHDRQWSYDLLAVLCEADGSDFGQRIGFVYYSRDNGVTWEKSLNVSTGTNGELNTAWITEA
jgi:hypothetical protein